jgi:hypothetical protein
MLAAKHVQFEVSNSEHMQPFFFPRSSNKPPLKINYMKGLNVLIPCASKVIGAEIAKAAARESANVILFAHSRDKLAALAQEIDAQCSGSSNQCDCRSGGPDLRSTQ